MVVFFKQRWKHVSISRFLLQLLWSMRVLGFRISWLFEEMLFMFEVYRLSAFRSLGGLCKGLLCGT